MKLRNKIALYLNLIIVSFGAYLYINSITKEKAEAAEIQSIVNQVIEKSNHDKQLNCIATNIYFEARNEGEPGQRAVAWVVLNRTASDKYPHTPCEVVYQSELDKKGNPIKNRCQFSWFCDGKSDEIKNKRAWDKAVKIAEDVMSKFGKETDPTGGSIMYHANYVKPYWIDNYERSVRIDDHIFYVKG